MLTKLFLVALLVFSSASSRAGEVTSLQVADSAALARLLKDPAFVGAYSAKGEMAEAIHAASAEILKTMMQQSGGSPEKLFEILENAKKDPAAFAAKLSPAALEKIREIAKRMPAGQLR